MAILNYRIDSLSAVMEYKNNMISKYLDSIILINQKLDNCQQTSIQQAQKNQTQIQSFRNNVKILRDSLSNMHQGLDFFEWEIHDFTWWQIPFNLKLLLPIANFEKPQGYTWISKDGKIKMQLLYNYTHAFDTESQEPKFYTQEEAEKYYSKELQSAESSYEDGFVIKGKKNNEIVFIKGMYLDFASMQGRTSGEPTWLWSNTVGIQVSTDEKNIAEYNYISELLSRTFNSKSIYQKL